MLHPDLTDMLSFRPELDKLTRCEATLLLILWSARGRLLEYDHLHSRLLTYGFGGANVMTLKRHLGKLQVKLRKCHVPLCIVTVRGLGVRLEYPRLWAPIPEAA